MARSQTTLPWRVRLRLAPLFCPSPMLRIIKGGYTVILVPRGENLETKAIKTAYSSTAGTAFVTFDKVRVPISNTLGKVGKGMQVILSNFNHEVFSYFRVTSATNAMVQRWMIASCALGMQRLVVEECLKCVRRFRVLLLLILMPMQVDKPAYCVRKTPTRSSRRPCQAGWNDFSRRVFPKLARVGDLPNEQRKLTVYPMANIVPHFLAQMSYDEQSDKLAGTIGLLKQSAPSLTLSHTHRIHIFVDTSRAQAGKLRKMLRRFSVGGRSRFREWAI